MQTNSTTKLSIRCKGLILSSVLGFTSGFCLATYLMLDQTSQAIQARDDALKAIEQKENTIYYQKKKIDYYEKLIYGSRKNVRKKA